MSKKSQEVFGFAELKEGEIAPLKEFEQRNKDTQELEAGLENLKAAEHAAKVEPSRLKRLLRTAAAFLALGVSMGVKEEVYEERPPRPEAEELKEPEATEERVILESLKKEMDEVATESNFLAALDVNNSKGDYIAHIGQVHYAPGITVELEKEVIRTQKNIEKLVLGLQRKQAGLKNIFVEGMATESAEVYFKTIDFVKKQISDISKDVSWFEGATDEYLKEAEFYDKFPEFLVEINYLYNQAAAKVRDEIFGRAANAAQKRKIEEDFRNLMTLVGNADGKLEERIYLRGAAKKLYLDGKISLIAAETAASHAAGLAAIRQFNLAARVFLRARDKKVSADELLKLGSEFEEGEKLCQEKCFENRENVAVELVIQKGGAVQQKFHPLIYGDAHNFDNNIKKWNQANPNKKLGLIRFTPQPIPK